MYPLVLEVASLCCRNRPWGTYMDQVLVPNSNKYEMGGWSKSEKELFPASPEEISELPARKYLVSILAHVISFCISFQGTWFAPSSTSFLLAMARSAS